MSLERHQQFPAARVPHLRSLVPAGGDDRPVESNHRRQQRCAFAAARRLSIEGSSADEARRQLVDRWKGYLERRGIRNEQTSLFELDFGPCSRATDLTFLFGTTRPEVAREIKKRRDPERQ